MLKFGAGWRLLFLSAVTAPAAVHAQSADELSRLSLADLAQIDVSSVTKSAGALSDAPASVFVITRDDILRSGATTLPEMLRLAPNLHVARTGASTYVVAARGQNGATVAQNFANKLLVLIDGRSVYTPLFSGVYWDMQQVSPADIDRIEVISGPGATLWGANAVNGVINVITRKSANTQGVAANVSGGTLARDASLRIGGHHGDSLSYRIYGNAHVDHALDLPSGGSARDKAHREQAGFRIDWTPAERDMFTLQGDLYGGKRAQGAAPDEHIRGHNILGRWNRSGAGGSSLQLQAYYDRAGRRSEQAGGSFAVNMYDVDVQHSFAPRPGHMVVWGGGIRANRYHINGSAGLRFAPARQTLWLVNGFVQDSIALNRQLTAIVGVKVEDDPYNKATVLPSLRLAWKPRADILVWGAASRAIRAPTPFDHDVIERLGGVDVLFGSKQFRSEKLTAYEAGTRLQPSKRSSLSLSAFYNRYDDLRTVESTPQTFFPLSWGNALRGRSYGFDAWADYQLTPAWRIGAAWSLLKQDFHIKAGGSGILGVQQLGDDPEHRASIRSSLDFGRSISIDSALRYVSKLPQPYVRHYIEFDARISWRMTDRLSVSVAGSNLLHDRHVEYAGANAVPRSIFAELRWLN